MRPIAFIAALLCAFLVDSSQALAAGDWSWPVRGQVVTPFQNGDDPYAAGQHRGVDIAAPIGTPVVAATAGTIAYAGVVGSSGLTVAERSADDGYELSYLHLSSLSVRRGQTVAAGDSVGAVGVSGTRSAEQPHLHFGVRLASDRHAYLDPLGFLMPPPAESPKPRPVTAPLPVPVHVDPEPAVIPMPVVAAADHPGPAHAYSGAAGHVLGSAPANAPLARHAAAPAPRLPHVPSHAHLPAGRPHHAQDPDRGHVAHGPAGHAPAPAHPAPVAHEPAAPRHHGGVGLGWLAACLGLVTAAALLAGPAGGRRGRGSGRAAFATLLRAGARQ